MLPSLPLGKLRAESGCCTSRVNGSVHLHTVVPGKNRNPQTVAPAKAGAQGGAWIPPQRPISTNTRLPKRPLPSSPTPIGNLRANSLSRWERAGVRAPPLPPCQTLIYKPEHPF